MTTQTLEFKPPLTKIDTHPVRVALVLDPSFTGVEERRNDSGFIYPLGACLSSYARHLAQNAFSRVVEYSSVEAAMSCPDADAILVPKFVKLELRQRGFGWDRRHALVVVEWTMKNIKNRKTLWVATVEGRGEGLVGDGFTIDLRDRRCAQDALDEMCQKSVEAFNRSQEIADFARSLARV